MDHLRFENIQKNEAVNVPLNPATPSNKDLVRRGKVGGNPEMTYDRAEKIDAWAADNLKGSDFKFSSRNVETKCI